MRIIKGIVVVIAAFLTMVSMTFTLVTAMGLLQGNIIGSASENLYFIGKNIMVTCVSLALIYLLGRDRDHSMVQQSFRNRKWLLGVSALLLAAFLFVVLQWPAFRSHVNVLMQYGKLSVGMVFGVYIGLLSIIGRILWRCPKCKRNLPFLGDGRSGLSIVKCPHCKVLLG
jgi:hypothetical protein